MLIRSWERTLRPRLVRVIVRDRLARGVSEEATMKTYLLILLLGTIAAYAHLFASTKNVERDRAR